MENLRYRKAEPLAQHIGIAKAFRHAGASFILGACLAHLARDHVEVDHVGGLVATRSAYLLSKAPVPKQIGRSLSVPRRKGPAVEHQQIRLIRHLSKSVGIGVAQQQVSRALRAQHGHCVSVYRDGVDDLHEWDSNAQPNELANPWPIASVSVSLAVGGTAWDLQLPGTIKTAVPTSSKA
jgi:hypothetical protein